MPQLICENLTLGYDGHPILEGLSFAVEDGDYLCIVGENGAGKSTLMRTILGLQPSLSGRVQTGAALKPTEIGYLPQKTALQQDFPASVREIVLSGFLGQRGLRPFYSKKEKLITARVMEELGISSFAKSCFRELSGGQQQRVLLARALVATQKMLLLDEPVAGLDPVATADMYTLINNLNKKDGTTVIMISHDIGAAIHYASHVLHIGKQIFFGTKEEYLQSELGRLFTKGGDEQ